MAFPATDRTPIFPIDRSTDQSMGQQSMNRVRDVDFAEFCAHYFAHLPLAEDPVIPTPGSSNITITSWDSGASEATLTDVSQDFTNMVTDPSGVIGGGTCWCLVIWDDTFDTANQLFWYPIAIRAINSTTQIVVHDPIGTLQFKVGENFAYLVCYDFQHAWFYGARHDGINSTPVQFVMPISSGTRVPSLQLGSEFSPGATNVDRSTELVAAVGNAPVTTIIIQLEINLFSTSNGLDSMVFIAKNDSSGSGPTDSVGSLMHNNDTFGAGNNWAGNTVMLNIKQPAKLFFDAPLSIGNVGSCRVIIKGWKV